MILLAGRADGELPKLIGLYAVAALVMLACYLCFLIAERISKTLGITGRAVISRLLGIILAALAVKFVVVGVLTLSHS
jgi:multiple antibiotic resistance protein